MSVPQIAIISNPKSTWNSRNFPAFQRAVDGLQNAFHYEISTVEDIPAALSAFKQTGPAIILINGGDGTLQATLSEIFQGDVYTPETVPPIGILPGGKTNMVAVDFGCGKSPIHVVKRVEALLAEDRLSGYIEDRNVIEMDLHNGEPSRFGMFFGGAGIVNGIEYCRDRIYPMGLPNVLSHPLAIFTLMGSAIFGRGREGTATHASSMEINLAGGGILRGRYLVALVTTLDKLLLGLRPYGHDGKGGLRFSCIEHRPGAVWRAVKGAFSGRYGKTSIEGVHVRRVDKMTLTGPDPVTLDGEIYSPGADERVTLRGHHTLGFLNLTVPQDD